MVTTTLSMSFSQWFKISVMAKMKLLNIYSRAKTIEISQYKMQWKYIPQVLMLIV